jgi:hypothetical protein
VREFAGYYGGAVASQVGGSAVLQDALRLKELLVSRATGRIQGDEAERREYSRLRSVLVSDHALDGYIPQVVQECRDLGEFWQFIKEKSEQSGEPTGVYARRQKYLKAEFDPLFSFLEERERSSTAPLSFPELEAFLSMVAQLLTLDGDALAVAVLSAGQPASPGGYDGGDEGERVWLLRLTIPARIFQQLNDSERTQCERNITAAAGKVSKSRNLQDWVGKTELVVGVEVRENWRAEAEAWLKGAGINNQGRVRSDNVASRQHDGLLFRSPVEICVYDALKAAGVLYAPLPVFLRGGKDYQRLEPDFVVFHEGRILLIEVDGDTVHRETPAAADQRTRVFKYEGALIERVEASECNTPEKARATVAKLLQAFKRIRAT